MATEFGRSMEECSRKNNRNGKINKKKKRGGRKPVRSKEATSSNVQAPPPSENLQKLYAACRDVFKDPDRVPSPSDVQTLSHILDSMTPQDVGLCHQRDFINVSILKELPLVACCNIYQCKDFSLSMFFLPKNAVIPLHNHPGMTVFSKLLLGKMHIKAYDWADPVKSHDNPSTPPGMRLAKLKANKVFTSPCKTTVLYPTTGGNIHEFKAIRPSVVLDVIGPPYSREEGRDCTYYRDTPCSALSSAVVVKEEAKMYGWLEEIEPPEGSQMVRMNYLGPEVVETE